MEMNLKDLFEVQRKLDAEIEKKHPVAPGEDRFAKKKLALLVEIGELANEQRSWKFWSKRKKPMTLVFVDCPDCNGTGFNDCSKCDGDSIIATNPLLEEYVDCVHFVLSIGNEYAERVPNFYEDYDGAFSAVDDFTFEDIPEQFNGVFYYTSKLGGSLNRNFYADIDLENYSRLFQAFVGLGEMLGFTEKQVVDAYMSKNKINYERQANGY